MKKGLEGKTLPQKQMLAFYGKKADTALAFLVSHAAEAFRDRAATPSGGTQEAAAADIVRANQSTARINIKTLGVALAGQLEEAINTGDGTWFRRLADTVESFTNPDDKVRACLLEFTCMCEQSGIKPPALTRRELQDIYEESYPNAPLLDPSHFLRLLKECGYPLKRDRIGAPNKSDSRRRRQS